MRTQYVETDLDNEACYDSDSVLASGVYIDADGDRYNGLPNIVAHDAPWATVAVDVEGGYMAFESVDDYETWARQQ